MKPKPLLTLAALALPMAAHNVCAQQYTVIRLIDLPDTHQSWALDVNAARQVTGSYMTDGWKRTMGFLWDDGQVVEQFIPRPGTPNAVPPHFGQPAHHVEATALNDAGAVTGVATVVNFGRSVGPYFSPTPSAGAYPDLLAVPVMNKAVSTDITNTYPMLCVGWGYVLQGSAFNRRAFAATVTFEDGIGDPPRRTYIAGLGSATSGATAWAVNDDWTIVGGVENNGGFVIAYKRNWNTGTMQLLGTLGGPASEAIDINEMGQVVGWAHSAPGRERAFLHDGSQMVDLGTLGGPASTARGINNLGQIVGEAWTASGEVHAFLYEGGQMRDLNDLVAPGSGWTLQRARAINDDGWIVGEGWIDGESHAFLLVPAGCYPNCDSSTQAPILNVADFACFLQKFAAADPYANCDGSTQPPVLNVADFACFLQAFAAGCP